MIGRVKDLLGLKGDAPPARQGDRLIPHEPLPPKAPEPPPARPGADTHALPEDPANTARIEAGLAAAVDKAEFSPSTARPAASPGDAEPARPSPEATRVAQPRPDETAVAPRSEYQAAPFAAAEESGPWLADAFDRLFAEEQGESPAAPFGGPFGLSDADLDRVAARVINRLSRGPMSEDVRRIVVEVSERLVREEIARIRDAAAALPDSSSQP